MLRKELRGRKIKISRSMEISSQEIGIFQMLHSHETQRLAKKIVTTTVSSREVGQRRRNKGKTTSSHICTETQRNLRNDKNWSEGGGRQKLKHADGDFPLCMRRESGDSEKKWVKTKIRKEEEEEEVDSNFETLTVTCHWVCEDLMKNTMKAAAAKKTTKTRRWAEAVIRAAGRKTAEAKRQAVAKICAAAMQ